MSFLSYSTGYQGVVDIFMRNPARYLPFSQLLAETMNGDSELSKPQREMIAFHVSKLNDCHYCAGAHKAVLNGLGVDQTMVSALENEIPEDPKLSAVLAFSTKLTNSPGNVSQQDVDSLRAVGWSDQAVEDVIGVVSLFAYLNRLVDGFGIKGSEDVFAQAGGMIAQHGYKPVVQMLEGKKP